MHATPDTSAPSLILTEGWHCLHLYYQVDPQAWKNIGAEARGTGAEELQHLLDPERDGAPQRLQVFAVAGQKADFGLMMMDPNPLRLEGIRQQLRASSWGPALRPVYSFVSITEVSEYVPTVEQYAQRLKQEGLSEQDPAYAVKVRAYEQRLPMMNRQRLYPEFPAWPVMCFYPMNKIRHPLANWYQEPFSRRSEMMAEHAISGIKFAGRVSQLITASTGLDDWEWGVTLWAKNPQYLKDIVYTMRFDTASARYAEFGPFYVGYIMPVNELWQHLRLQPTP
ncbi:MAG: heme peroxidase [Planctomycetaceae bacterium]|nr:MAG: heme peroxidase [Planctomycetaceae bacterium]